MWIEFVGLPGSGKSTIARSLRALLKEKGFECRERAPFALLGRSGKAGRTRRLLWGASDLVWATGFTLGRPEVREDLILGGMHSCLTARYWRLMRIWAALLRLRDRERNQDAGRVTVLDQGILQCLRSIYPKDASQPLMSRLTHSWVRRMEAVLPDLVVLVCVDEVTAVSRMRARPFQGTSWNLEHEELDVELSPVRIYMEQTLPAALAASSISVLRLDGTKPPEANVRKVMKHMQGMHADVN